MIGFIIKVDQSKTTYAINVMDLKDIYFNPQEFKKRLVSFLQRHCFNLIKTGSGISVPTDD